MKKMVAMIAMLAIGIVKANISPTGFEAFNYNRVFVETGTFDGLGIRYALRAGFKEIHSMELFKQNVDTVRRMFANTVNVTIYQGDTSRDLYNVIKHIDEPITFWLDAHSGINDDSGNNCPLLKELDQIKRHHIKTHTILIDDMHCAGKGFFDYITKEDIMKKIKEINPQYIITFIPGGNDAEYPENVMVARVPGHGI